MRKKEAVKRPNLLSIKLLLSYLSILAVPLFAMIVVYSTASNLMYTVQQERMYANLQSTATDIQRSLQEAANLGAYIATLPEVAQLEKSARLAPDGKVSFFQMYQFSKMFPDYTLFNSDIRDIYFFFGEQDYVMRLPAVVPADNRAYTSIGPLLADDYDTMVRFLGDSYWNAQLVALNSAQGGNLQMGVLQSFPYSAYEAPFGTILILLDDDALNQRLQGNLMETEGLVVVLDGNGRVIKQFSGENNHLDADTLDYATMGAATASTFSIHGKEYAVCSEKNTLTGYTFYSAVPKSVLVARAGYIKPVIAILSVLSMLIGLWVCVLLWSRRRRVVLRYSRYADEFGTVAEKGGNLWDGLHAVLDSVAQLQTTVHLQGSFVRSGVIQKLLNGEYASRQQLESDLATADVHVEGSLYCVAVVGFNRGFHKASTESINEFRLRMLQRIEMTLEIPHYCCEPEDLHLAVFIPIAGEDSLDIVKMQLRALEDAFIAAEQVEGYIGLGDCVEDMMGIGGSYRQARSVCEYLRFYNIRSVMEFGQLPASHETFFFSLEMELRLIRAIEQGNHMELQEVFGQLAVENFASRQLSYETNKRLLELVRSTALRALRENTTAPLASGDMAQCLGDALWHADSLEQIFVLLEGQMPVAAQKSNALEGQKIDARKEKIRAYLEGCYGKEDLTLAAVAQEMTTSETRFYKEFKQLFGVTFSEYVENLRISKACELLRAQTRVKDVSQLVGYSSDYSFRRAFKRVMSITPSTYMENLGTHF